MNHHDTLNATSGISALFAFSGALTVDRVTFAIGVTTSIITMLLTWYLNTRAQIADARRKQELADLELQLRKHALELGIVEPAKPA